MISMNDKNSTNKIIENKERRRGKDMESMGSAPLDTLGINTSVIRTLNLFGGADSKTCSKGGEIQLFGSLEGGSNGSSGEKQLKQEKVCCPLSISKHPLCSSVGEDVQEIS